MKTMMEDKLGQKNWNSTRNHYILIKHYYNDLMTYMENYGLEPEVKDEQYKENNPGLLKLLKGNVSDAEGGTIRTAAAAKRKTDKKGCTVMFDWHKKCNCPTDIFLHLYQWYVQNKMNHMDSDDWEDALEEYVEKAERENCKQVTHLSAYKIERFNIMEVAKSIFGAESDIDGDRIKLLHHMDKLIFEDRTFRLAKEDDLDKITVDTELKVSDLMTIIAKKLLMVAEKKQKSLTEANIKILRETVETLEPERKSTKTIQFCSARSVSKKSQQKVQVDEAIKPLLRKISVKKKDEKS